MIEKITIKELNQTKKLIELYYKKYGKVPSLSWLKQRTNITKDNLIKIIKHLQKEKFLQIKDGKIYLKGMRIKNKKLFNQNNWIIILRYLLLVIGIGAIYMSVYYSHNWLSDFLSPFRAFLLALIMVAFAVSAFELIVFFKQHKRYFLVIIFSILWTIVTVFSMISTIAGQYNARIEKLNEQYKEEKTIAENDIKNQEYTEQKNELYEKKKILNDDIRQIQTVLSQYITKEDIEKNKKLYNRLQYKYYSAKKELNKTLYKLKSLRNSYQHKVIKKSPPDFYLWLSKIFNWRPEMIQFWLSIFPAIFIDLIAPISIAIVMFGDKI